MRASWGEVGQGGFLLVFSGSHEADDHRAHHRLKRQLLYEMAFWVATNDAMRCLSLPGYISNGHNTASLSGTKLQSYTMLSDDAASIWECGTGLYSITAVVQRLYT